MSDYVKLYPKQEAINLILNACQAIRIILRKDRVDLKQLGQQFDCISRYLFSVSLNSDIIASMTKTDNVARARNFKPVFEMYHAIYQ
jgi:hypothetical protein